MASAGGVRVIIAASSARAGTARGQLGDESSAEEKMRSAPLPLERGNHKKGRDEGAGEGAEK